MRLYRLNASALELSPSADAFLQAYTTQTPSAPRGAFIDTKGKAVAVYDSVRLDADRSILIMANDVRERLVRHLKSFLFLTGTHLKHLPHSVYWDLDGSVRPEDGEWVLLRTAGRIWVSTSSAEAAVGEEEFRLFRWRNRLALQGVDYDDPMLLNLDDPDLVSFAKGCYLGQEIMARVRYRGKPPFRLAALRETECPLELRELMTSRVRDAAGDVVGFTFLPTV